MGKTYNLILCQPMSNPIKISEQLNRADSSFKELIKFTISFANAEELYNYLVSANIISSPTKSRDFRIESYNPNNKRTIYLDKGVPFAEDRKNFDPNNNMPLSDAEYMESLFSIDWLKILYKNRMTDRIFMDAFFDKFWFKLKNINIFRSCLQEIRYFANFYQENEYFPNNYYGTAMNDFIKFYCGYTESKKSSVNYDRIFELAMFLITYEREIKEKLIEDLENTINYIKFCKNMIGNGTLPETYQNALIGAQAKEEALRYELKRRQII